MPEVIADTSPVQYLFQIGHLDLLPALYGSILVPEAVAEELAEGRSRGVHLPDLSTLPWLQVVSAPIRRFSTLVVDLGRGEREVLALAAERPGVLLLLDDGLARRFAKHLQVSFTGTLGVLLRSKEEGHLTVLRPTVDRLQSLGFWLDATTREAVLELAGEV